MVVMSPALWRYVFWESKIHMLRILLKFPLWETKDFNFCSPCHQKSSKQKFLPIHRLANAFRAKQFNGSTYLSRFLILLNPFTIMYDVLLFKIILKLVISNYFNIYINIITLNNPSHHFSRNKSPNLFFLILHRISAIYTNI